jgi:hypothetical protein
MGLLDALQDPTFRADVGKNAKNLLQSTSNTLAENVSMPVDVTAWLLRKAGVPIPENPTMGSDWMRQNGLTAAVQPGPSAMAGETLGLLAPMAATKQGAAAAAKGLLAMQESAKGLPVGLSMKSADEGGILGALANSKNYGLEHRPMTIEGGAAPLHDLAQSFGEDVYGKQALQFYGSGDKREAAALKVMHSVKNNPNAEVTIYRGVPKGVNSINSGDWVTISPEVAKDYGNVISMKVPASHITSWPDSLLEFGYYPTVNKLKGLLSP